ncbi:universal stress protein [Saccharothrix longispora]|uniref:Nucleotide-binding universal stress UspA family protein n=1 Tax=Saccharothrix longispora TaxID=33920 RepID=A0ABU1PPM6_9PSEU|nr:universal stress protein [Saccharothrix longispora]MDR6592621.1 nucleotide-binding universal stress UspA family protein [Saccharothrix longispora]
MIVVGVDGSAPSREALRWTLTRAARTGEAVEATMAWLHEPESAAATATGVHPHAGDHRRRHPARELHAVVEDVRASVPGAPPVSEATVVGDTDAVLLRAARQADLLVIGSRRHHPAEALPGGVAARCLRHAPCPVVVVPPAPRVAGREPRRCGSAARTPEHGQARRGRSKEVGMGTSVKARRRAVATGVAEVTFLWAAVGCVLALVQGLLHMARKRLRLGLVRRTARRG